jgi:outer membrane protein assembly factor BamB
MARWTALIDLLEIPVRGAPKGIFAASLSVLLAFSARAADWPQWRGPGRDNAWNEKGIVETFPVDGLKGRWSAPIGFGYSSPVVADGRVYVTDSVLDKPKARERIHCFEAVSGKPLWTYTYDMTPPEWGFTPNNEIRPTSTPIVRDGKLYSLGAVGNLLCLDAVKGEVLWRKELSKEYPTDDLICHASPLIEGDLLIVFAGVKPACVIAFDRNTGKEAWQSLEETVTYSSPIVITAGGARQLVVWTKEAITSLDPATGRAHWRQAIDTSKDTAVATPVVDKDLLLVGGVMMRLDARKPAASVLWPDPEAAAPHWLSPTSTALLLGQHIYSAKTSGEFVCLDAATGKEIWKTDKVTDVKNGASIHLTRHGDSVLLYTERGELIRARLSPEGYKELSRTTLVAPTYPFAGRNVAWAPPAYADGRVFARSDKELVSASLAAE